MPDPLVIEGFYATRLLTRRLFRFVVFLILLAATIALSLAAAGVAAIDVLLISWGAS